MDINTLQAYAYFFFVAILAVGLYMYIYHLYTAKKSGTRDYEKYSDIALNDDITDIPVDDGSVNRAEPENKEHK